MPLAYICMHLCVCVCMCVLACLALQGLSAAVMQRIPQWQFTGPFEVWLLIHPHTPNVASAVQAALSQLSGLPAGTTVIVDFEEDSHAKTAHHLAATAATIAAATPALRHVRVLAPPTGDGAAALAALLAQQPAPAHAAVYGFKHRLSGEHGNIPWPWQSLRVGGPMELSELLRLPNPCGGQYELVLECLRAEKTLVRVHVHVCLSCCVQRHMTNNAPVLGSLLGARLCPTLSKRARRACLRFLCAAFQSYHVCCLFVCLFVLFLRCRLAETIIQVCTGIRIPRLQEPGLESRSSKICQQQQCMVLLYQAYEQVYAAHVYGPACCVVSLRSAH